MKNPPVVVLVVTDTREVQHKREPVTLVTYEVRSDDARIGEVQRRMVTHETKTPGKRYVNRRWETPGWVYRRAGTGRSLTCSSRRAGIRALLVDNGMHPTDAATIAATTKVVTP